MLEISFSKLIMVAAVALIVIGPERLPNIARTAGLLMGRLQRYIADVKRELHQEMEKAAFSKIEETFHASYDEIKASINPLSSKTQGAAHGAADTVEMEAGQLINPNFPSTEPTAASDPFIIEQAPTHKKTVGSLATEKKALQRDFFNDTTTTPNSPTEHCDRR